MDTFTKKDLADAVIAEHTAFRKTRGIMDNNTDTGNQYAYLGANSVDVHLKGFSGALLHHKYLIVDAENPTGTDYIETGSHNWSTAAETQNDENAVILQSNRVANLYLQEFAARYYEAGGTDSIHLTLFPTIAFTPTSLILDSVDVGSTSQDSFKISNSGNGPLNVSGFSSTNPRFTVSPPTASIAPSDSETFTVTFAPTVSGFQTGKIVFTHNAIGSPDTVTVQGYGIDTTHFITFTTSVNNRWNMVSVPIKVADYRKTILFPTATSSAFAFSGGYITRDTLRKHEGYWLKFGSDQQPSFYGVAIAKDTFPVVASWNMIGSITYPVPVTAITQVPSGNVQTSYFGYSNGYVVADTIKPGQSYWVKVTSPGTLTLGTTPGSTLAKNDNVLDKLNSVTFTDAAGNKQTLYFGNSPDEKFTTAAFQMPPVPPAGAFDVRYRNGNLVVLRSTASTSQQQFPVDMQGATFPVTVTWNVSDMSSRYSLNVGNTPTTLTASGSMQLTESNGQSVTLTMDDGNLPQVYSLGQNYPNPFNPTTTISFALPKQSIVSLKIYSALGQQVLAIADQEQFDAGVHAMKIDGSSLSSGVYYYRIDAVATGDASTQFHATKSLLLLK